MNTYRKLALVGMALGLLAGSACGAASTPTPKSAGIAEYVEVVDDVNNRVRNLTARMVPVLTVIAGLPGNRANYADTTNQILDDFQLQLQRLEEIEPAPQQLAKAHELMKIAIGDYVRAVSLFLPGAELADSGRFDMARYSEYVNAASLNFQLATESIDEGR